jgi:hypothetical protein
MLMPRYLEGVPTAHFLAVGTSEAYYMASPDAFYLSFGFVCSPSIGDRHRDYEYTE